MMEDNLHRFSGKAFIKSQSNPNLPRRSPLHERRTIYLAKPKLTTNDYKEETNPFHSNRTFTRRVQSAGAYTKNSSESLTRRTSLASTALTSKLDVQSQKSTSRMSNTACELRENSASRTTAILATRGTEFEYGPVNILNGVLARSCRRRSARLNPQVRKEIIATHRKTSQQKVTEYYEKLNEKRLKLLTEESRRAKAVKTFRRIVLTVRWIIRWKHVMISISQERMMMTAMEMDWHTRTTDRKAGKSIQFDKDDYSRERVCTRLPQWAERVLRKPADWRNESECKKLHALLRSLKSFEKFTEQIQMAMCQSMNYERVEPKRIILRQGHPGYCFYLIFSGSVFVNVDDKNNAGKTFQKTTAILRQGEAFGEMALLQDTERAATITCREKCELLTIAKDVFARICPAIFEKELHERIKFLSTLELFNHSDWSKTALRFISLEAQIKQYKTGKVIVADNSNDEWIYVCMSGECKVIKCLVMEGKENAANKQNSQVTNLFTQLANANTARRMSIMTVSQKSQITGENSEEDLNSAENKLQLLNSMALEWFKTHDKVEELRRQNQQGAAESNANMSGIKSFTSLINDSIEMASQHNMEVVFVEIARLKSTDFFDLHAVISGDLDTKTRGSQLTLVSSGAQMLRFKRNDFLKAASLNALDYCRGIASEQKYPGNRLLLERYVSIHQWEAYKTMFLENLIKHGKLHEKDIEKEEFVKAQHISKANRNSKLLKTLAKIDYTEKEEEKENKQRQFSLQEEADHEKKKAEEDDLKMFTNKKVSEISPPFCNRRKRRVDTTGCLPKLVEHLLTNAPSRIIDVPVC